jgi:hypothetical protein
VDLSRLVSDLDAEDGGPRVSELVLVPERPHGASGRDGSSEGRSGIVAVTPDVMKGTRLLAELERHAELTRRPIIGVITYRGRGSRRRPTVPPAGQRRSTADTADRAATAPAS